MNVEDIQDTLPEHDKSANTWVVWENPDIAVSFSI